MRAHMLGRAEGMQLYGSISLVQDRKPVQPIMQPNFFFNQHHYYNHTALDSIYTSRPAKPVKNNLFKWQCTAPVSLT